MNGDTSFEKVDGNRGWLRHGNPPFDLRMVPKCGARNRAGGSCACPAMKNGRCRLHGGKSTGPRTAEGKARIAAAHLRHGRATGKATAERKANAETRRRIKILRFLARKGEHPTQLDALLESGGRADER